MTKDKQKDFHKQLTKTEKEELKRYEILELMGVFRPIYEKRNGRIRQR